MPIGNETEDYCKQCLSGHDLLGALDDFAVGKLLSASRFRSVKAGEMLFQQDDVGEELFILIEGQIKIVTFSENGKEVILNILKKGSIFGEIAFIDGGLRTATAIAESRARLVAISRKAFVALSKDHPSLLVPLVQVLCARLRWVSEAYEDVLFNQLPQRLARKLLVLASLNGPPDHKFQVEISQTDLANTLGVSREKINRQLNVWQTAGALSLKRGAIIICDEDFIRGVLGR